jgi:membrane complex biogenesis BtpA family protein
MKNIFTKSGAIIGMIHAGALPGTPASREGMDEILTRVREEALLYRKSGVDMLLVENMHDLPYLKGRVGPEITAAMALVGYEAKRAAGLPCGVQILAGANLEALAAARAAGLDFIRVEGFVFAHVADEGLIEGCAGELLRYRRRIGADDVLVLADIKKKHASHALTIDVDIVETARAASFFGADGVIVTGKATGEPADPGEVRLVREALEIPVLVGSGVNLENAENYLGLADALIVGSYFKKDGCWANSPDPERVRSLMKKIGRTVA